MSKKMIETLAIHAGQEPDPSTGAIMTPIYQTSTYVQDGVGETRGYEYSRTGNPTRTALEGALAGLEGGKYGLAFASGMASTDMILRLLNPGDHILSGNDVYGGTFRLFDKVYRRYGLEFTYVDTSDLAQVKQNLRPETKLVWLETPTNPLLNITDLQAVADILASHPNKPLLAVDNTFATPYLQRPLELGADIVVHSTTKYLGGHSDAVGGGVVLNSDEHYERLAFMQNAVGAVPGPMDCFLVLRGIKTLHVRMDRHAENATAVTDYLSEHPKVGRVIYPFDDTHPHREVAKKQMRSGGGMVSFVMKGGVEAARKVAENAEVFALAESLGGVESLIEIPAAMTHMSVAESELAVDPGLVRLSVGIEHKDDLIADIEQALDKA
ncbi:MAG: cystathionine gamma-synthase [Chloroflexi bacterium]|nr:MAG: cystathionine gamma-synthase [Chloroflexota bacterium]MBL1196551.1 cystathionine gamma-synthase [Chloroflexota bacterium]NOH13846.1 cystathionine gamma-synthase [Chloroflexota bacterium]